MIDFETLNRNLIEAEGIISSKYHFRFEDLSKDDVSLSDLMMSVLQARVIAEGICRFIVLHKKMVKDEKSIRNATLKVYIEDLLRPNMTVPKPVISNLSLIQEKSNYTVHFQVEGRISLTDTHVCLEALDQVLVWFVKEYGKDALTNSRWIVSSEMLKKSGKIPIKAEGCMISRKTEISEVREKILAHKVVIIKGITGVGKTELVKDYVKKYRRRYNGVYYAENIDEIDDYLYDLPVGIMDQDLKTKDEVIVEKLKEVHAMKDSYLFIVDDYSGQIDALRHFLPDQDDKYHMMILVGDDYPVNEQYCCYEVKPFSSEESYQIFRFFCDREFEVNEVESLLSYLEYNPRAIKMSAVFLNDNTSYTPKMIMEIMNRNTSVKGIMQNLYTVLMELSILEKDYMIKLVAQCLSLIPYNGVEKERFITLLDKAISKPKDTDKKEETQSHTPQIEQALKQLEDAKWIQMERDSGTDGDIISVNPLLSDTIFEKTQPDLNSEIIFDFIFPILKPIKTIRELYISQVIALEPYIDHFAKRAESAGTCNLEILNQIREYYIAIYNLPKIDHITSLMEREYLRYPLDNVVVVERGIYRQGISRFNLEDFDEAHLHFSRALSLLDCKIKKIEELISTVCAYEGTSLAVLGDRDKAIECINRSIVIREKHADQGDKEQAANLWISHYNYAKVLMEFEDYDKALEEINLAVNIYKDHYSDKYQKKESTNVSSLFQLKGRILAKLGNYDEAILLLEDAKDIREKLKGETYFSTAQVYSSLMDVYSDNNDYQNALRYAQKYYVVLIKQYKTEDINVKIKEVEMKISMFKEKLSNAEIYI